MTTFHRKWFCDITSVHYNLHNQAQMVKNLPTMWGTQVLFLSRKDPLGMAMHSSILAWRIPWTEEPCGLQSMGSQSQTQLSTNTHIHGWLVQSTKSSSH